MYSCTPVPLYSLIAVLLNPYSCFIIVLYSCSSYLLYPYTPALLYSCTQVYKYLCAFNNVQRPYFQSEETIAMKWSRSGMIRNFLPEIFRCSWTICGARVQSIINKTPACTAGPCSIEHIQSIKIVRWLLCLISNVRKPFVLSRKLIYTYTLSDMVWNN